jgi:bla regulator protein BlaR1
MVLVKPAKPGPRLVPHDRGQACDEKPTPETWPTECYSYAARLGKEGMFLAGSRATSMEQIGKFVGSQAGASGEIGRRVVDQTGLTGLWDFTLEAAPPVQTAPSPTPVQDAAPAGPTMLEALQDQLGIRLRPARAVVSVLVVDHLQRPDEN